MPDNKKDNLADALAAMMSGEVPAETEGEEQLIEGEHHEEEASVEEVHPPQPAAAPKPATAKPLEQSKPKPALTIRPTVVRKTPVTLPKPAAPKAAIVHPAAPVSNRPASPIGTSPAVRPAAPAPMPTAKPRPATPVPAVVKPAASNPAPAKQRPARPIAPVAPEMVTPPPTSVVQEAKVESEKVNEERGIVAEADVSNPNQETDVAIKVKADPEEAEQVGVPVEGEAVGEVADDFVVSEEITDEEAVEAAADDDMMMPSVPMESLAPTKPAAGKKRVVQIPLTQRMEFKQTVIPILLTSSGLMLIISILIFSGWDEFPLEGQTGMAITMLVGSVLMAAAAVFNMLQVKHLLSQKQ